MPGAVPSQGQPHPALLLLHIWALDKLNSRLLCTPVSFTESLLLRRGFPCAIISTIVETVDAPRVHLGPYALHYLSDLVQQSYGCHHSVPRKSRTNPVSWFANCT